MVKFKVGDEVKVKEVPRIGTTGGKIETVKKVEAIEVNQGIWFKHYLSNQEEYPVPYFFFDELEKVETIEEIKKDRDKLRRMYKNDVRYLFKQADDLENQLKYAEQQLKEQEKIIKKLKDHIQILLDTL